jgi:hypothetical protein
MKGKLLTFYDIFHDFVSGLYVKEEYMLYSASSFIF